MIEEKQSVGKEYMDHAKNADKKQLEQQKDMVQKKLQKKLYKNEKSQEGADHMKKRIIGYRMYVDSILLDKRKRSPQEWERILEEHLTQIGFFQHERLIHLIVTVTFALMTLISMIASVTICMPLLLALSLLFLVLLVPYIFHYYTLENEVQKMYTQYDEIRKRI